MVVIVTYNNNGVYIGDVVVKDYDKLKELRDALLTINDGSIGIKKVSEDFSLGGVSSVLNEGIFRKGNNLVFQNITKRFDDDCFYNRVVYKCLNLNSILMCTSLIGNIDINDYTGLVREFIRLGIVYCPSFDAFWEKYSNAVVSSVYNEIEKKDIRDIEDFNKLLKKSLTFFRMLLEDDEITGEKSIIGYDCKKLSSVNKSNFSDEELSKIKGTKKNLDQFNVNNALLLGDNSIFYDYIKKRSKIR